MFVPMDITTDGTDLVLLDISHASQIIWSFGRTFPSAHLWIHQYGIYVIGDGVIRLAVKGNRDYE